MTTSICFTEEALLLERWAACLYHCLVPSFFLAAIELCPVWALEDSLPPNLFLGVLLCWCMGLMSASSRYTQ